MLTCTSERRRRIIGKKNKEIKCSGLLLPVEYLRNGKRYSSFVFTFGKRKSRATERYKRRRCSCYRFSDIIVVNINNFSILLEQIQKVVPNESSRTT